VLASDLWGWCNFLAGMRSTSLLKSCFWDFPRGCNISIPNHKISPKTEAVYEGKYPLTIFLPGIKLGHNSLSGQQILVKGGGNYGEDLGYWMQAYHE
jgi:hypothetical protein